MKKILFIPAIFLCMLGKTLANTISTPDCHCDAHYFGERFGGGVIFYIDETGKHGLIAALHDSSVPKGISWGKNLPLIELKDGVGAGKINSQLISKYNYGQTNAASLARSLRDGGFNDWYLPSRYELALLFDHRFIVPGLDGSSENSAVYPMYWSSNSAGDKQAYAREFSYYGYRFEDALNISSNARVRAIRQF